MVGVQKQFTKREVAYAEKWLIHVEDGRGGRVAMARGRNAVIID